MKSAAYLNYARGQHNLRLAVNYVDDYVDDGLSILAGSPLEQYIREDCLGSHTTWDTHYSYRLPGQRTILYASVLNLADTDPPRANREQRYDASTHNAYGRSIKLGFSLTL